MRKEKEAAEAAGVRARTEIGTFRSRAGRLEMEVAALNEQLKAAQGASAQV
jgi:hypothetical protein